ncbi:ABC transporter substrate-binding protein [Sphaerisporangium fuscum]|uniref:ABC transporter substrate-binding protein n=1 Tax=Sphaerisporangium fuscum TaxID=2835868 RepID=UPI001BDCA196|nr:ABC transporter substrate-binding protein [Sphaerisporangium fuscum]
MRRSTTGMAAAVAALGLAATGCGDGSSAGAQSGGGGTVTIAISADPGSLAPLTTLASTALFLNTYAYDTLVHVAQDGSLVSGVAEKWTATTTSAQFTLKSGVTCEDGSPLAASDVAAEYNYIAAPKNQSPLLGLSVPQTATASADDAARTVSVKTTKPAPFILEMTSLLPLVCKKGLADPKALARASNASGPYRLAEAVPGDHYTYVKRSGYTWGPGGAPATGMPDKVTFKVVANESTATNLLLSGDVNVVQVNGSDRQRLAAAQVLQRSVRQTLGQLLFNEAPGHPTADPAVRRALVTAVDLKQIGSVAANGQNEPPTNLGVVKPTPCTGDSVTGNVPGRDTAQAAAALTSAGWTKTGDQWTKDGRTLTVTLPHPTNLGPQVLAAVELAVQQWTAFGVKVTPKPVTPATVTSTMMSDGWDMAWLPINVYLPDQLTRFYDGPRPPQGTNFGGIANPDYKRLTAQASAKQGTAGCELWTAAESALIKRLDVVPFATLSQTFYGKGVSFQIDGAGVVPQTLRRTAG